MTYQNYLTNSQHISYQNQDFSK